MSLTNCRSAEESDILSQGGVASYILGGWQANTIVTKQTGNTIQLGAPDQSLSGGQHTSRPDCIGDGRAGASDDPRSGLWLNPAAFAVPALGQFGNCGVGRYHGPGFTNVDISLFKIFPIRETMRVEFRSRVFQRLQSCQFFESRVVLSFRFRNHFLNRWRSSRNPVRIEVLLLKFSRGTPLPRDFILVPRQRNFSSAVFVKFACPRIPKFFLS